MATKHLRGVALSVQDTGSDRDARDPRRRPCNTYPNWVCESPFYLLVKGETPAKDLRVPIRVGITFINAPCELVVVLGEDPHPSHRVQLICGDWINFSCDNWEAALFFWMPTKSHTAVHVADTDDGYTIATVDSDRKITKYTNCEENPTKKGAQ
jgi:hypothetical protein